MARPKKIRFEDFREDLIIRKAAGESITASPHAPLSVLEPDYHPAEEIDRAIYRYFRGKGGLRGVSV